MSFSNQNWFFSEIDIITYVILAFINIILLLIVVFISLSFIIYLVQLTKKNLNNKSKKQVFGILHPSCNAAGGGEKVLWTMVKELEQYDDIDIEIYTGENEKQDDILQKVKVRFNIHLRLDKLKIIKVAPLWLLTPKPYLTMIMSILGQIVFALMTIIQHQPDLIFENQGYGFTYFIIKIFLPNCKLGLCVHFPFISQDTLDDTLQNNSMNYFKQKLKYQYQMAIYKFYQFQGRFPDLIITGSSWAQQHFNKIWNQKNIALLPPCTIKDQMKFTLEDRLNIIVSFAQFRPEKNHEMQIKIFKKVKDQLVQEQQFDQMKIKMIMIGSTRGEQDEKFSQSLEQIIKNLNLQVNTTIFKLSKLMTILIQKFKIQNFNPNIQNLQNDIEIMKNLKYADILNIFKKAKIGIHTMYDEHFGISVVEMMASGLVVIAHNSAGPKFDTIQNNSRGFLAENEEQFVSYLLKSLKMNEQQRITMTLNARQHVQKFSDENFRKNFSQILEIFVESLNDQTQD